MESSNKSKASGFLKQGSILAIASILVRVIGLVYRIPMANIIGNEGNGLTDEITALADHKIKIPMKGKVESLNAAVSATILMYETMRQREFM